LRARFSRADVFADEMRLTDRHVKFRRRLRGIARSVFDGETFLPGGALGSFRRFAARALIKDLQTEKTPDPMLHVNDVIAFLEFREIDVERRAR
jgi:hypothetical protein